MNAADESRFRRGFAMVMATYPNVQVGPAMVRAYWEALKDRMDADAFEGACSRLMVADREFPPRPRDFIDAADGDPAVEAHRWWERLTDFTRSGPYRYHVPTESHVLAADIPPRARFALDAVGGPARLGGASERDLDFIRQRFETAYRTATSHEIERPGQPLLPRTNGGVKRIGSVLESALPKGQA